VSARCAQQCRWSGHLESFTVGSYYIRERLYYSRLCIQRHDTWPGFTMSCPPPADDCAPTVRAGRWTVVKCLFSDDACHCVRVSVGHSGGMAEVTLGVLEEASGLLNQVRGRACHPLRLE
jgi:hypothetical protein